jgi:ubiquinone biosynthesis monooxygenase Coq7
MKKNWRVSSAKRIYEGQLAVLKNHPKAAVIRHIAEQEARHLEAFTSLMREHRVRPTALQPLWHVAGFALGAASALLGTKAAMACTVAVEEVIDAHYAAQENTLSSADAPLRAQIAKFRAEEVEHRDTGLAHGAEEAPAYRALHAAVSTATRAAIWLSERV